MSHIENMKKMLECVTEKSKAQLEASEENVDIAVFSAEIDMIKDLSDSIYKSIIVKAMDDAEEDGELKDKIMELTSGSEMRFYNDSRYKNGRYAPMRHYTEPYYYDPYMEYGMHDKRNGKMYYPMDTRPEMTRHYDGQSMTSSDGSSMNGIQSYGGSASRNYTESRYDHARRNYTETRDSHKSNTPQDKEMKMRELEKYLTEMSNDVTGLVRDMTPEETELLRNKINVLATKI